MEEVFYLVFHELCERFVILIFMKCTQKNKYVKPLYTHITSVCFIILVGPAGPKYAFSMSQYFVDHKLCKGLNIQSLVILIYNLSPSAYYYRKFSSKGGHT